MSRKLKVLIIVVLLSLVPTLLVWFPFFFRASSFWGIPLPQNGLATIVANYDGPLYLVAAKTMYNKDQIKANFQFPLSTEYYTAHFPLFPVLIKVFGFVTNYPYAMLIVTLVSSALALYFFYKLTDNLYLTALFSIFPARWLIVRSVGSADPLFIAAIIASIYFFKNKKYLWAGIWGVVAQITKSPGILLFASYALFILFEYTRTQKLHLKKYLPILLIPLSLVGVFSFYHFTQGNFWQYFNSGDNIHLFFPPFQIFNYSAPWVGTFWLEEVLFVYLIGAIGVFKLFEKKEYEMAFFSVVFFVLSLFISHRDIVRYILPLVPFLFVAYSDVLMKKEVKIAMAILIIPIYLYSLSFISQNVMPISNWAPFI